MKYSLIQRGKTYSVKFRVPDDRRPDGWRQVLKATGATSKAKAHQAAIEIVETERAKAGAEDETSREIYDIVREAGKLALQGYLTESRARQFIADLLKISRGSEMEAFTIRAWCEKWLEELEVKEGTRKQYAGSINQFLHFLGTAADDDLMTLDDGAVDAFRKSRIDAGLRAGTIKDHFVRLRACFNDAVTDRALATNPFIESRKARKAIAANKVTRGRRAFTIPELSMLLRHLDGEWKGMAYVGLYAGARIDDAARLQWKQVDLAKGEITIDEEKKDDPALRIPMHADLLAWMMEQRSTDNPNARVFRKLSKESKDDLSRRFVELIGEAGIENETFAPPKAKGRQQSKGKTTHALVFHSLRHSNATIMANEGVADEVRMLVTGHKSKEVHAGYTDIQAATMRKAIDKIPSFEGGEE